MVGLLGQFGQAVLARARELLQIVALLYAAIKGAVIEGRRGRRMVVNAAITQVYFTAVEPLAIFLLVAVTCGFFAIVLSDSLMRPNGLAPHIPTVIAQAVVRELVPLVIALIVIGRSGPAIATELGYMRVNDEIEALDLAGANTDYLIVLPRIAGVTIATAALTIAMSAAAGICAAISAIFGPSTSRSPKNVSTPAPGAIVSSFAPRNRVRLMAAGSGTG